MIYILLAILLFMLVFNYDIQKNKIGKNFMYNLTFILFILISTLRFRVGGDSLLYEDLYPIQKDIFEFTSFRDFENDLSYQPLWMILVGITKAITNEYAFFQFVHAFIFNFIFFKFIKKFSEKPFTVIFLFYVSLLYFYYDWEIQRESLAIAVFLLNIKNLINKRWFKYYLLCMISFLFHQSAVILFIFPFFIRIKFNNKFIVTSFILATAFLLTRSFGIDIVRYFLFTSDMRLKYDIYSERNFNLNGMIVYFFIRIILFLPLAFSGIANHEKYKNMNWFFIAFTIISVISPFVNGAERFLNYLYPIYLIVFVDFLYNSKIYIGNNNLKKKLISICIFVQIFFIISNKLFSSNEYGNYYSLFYPYTNIFNPVRVPEREYYNWNVAR